MIFFSMRITYAWTLASQSPECFPLCFCICAKNVVDFHPTTMDRANTVIFDFDGTIADTFALSVETSNLLAPRFGYRTVAQEEVVRLKKLTAPELFRHLEMPLARLPAILARARKEMAQEIPRVKIFDGMASVIDSLLAAGLQLGIVTSNSTQNVRDCLANNGVLEKFEFIHSATNLFGKHRTLRRLMRRMGLSGERVVYVGDETRDIEASKKCRIPVIAVSWGFQDRASLELHQPDFLADVPGDVEMFVHKLFQLTRGF